MDHAQSLVHPSNSIGQFFSPHILEKIARRARFERPAQISSTCKRGHNHDASPGAAPFQFGGDIKTAHVRHFDIRNKYIGLVGQHGLECLSAVARLRDHRDVAFDFQQCCQRAQYHALVFSQHDANAFAPVFGALPRAFFGEWIQFLPLPFFTGISFKGSVISSLVPDLSLRSNVPPIISTRSRIPRRPLPSTFTQPCPSSEISSRHDPFCCSRRKRQLEARACRTTFVTPSRTARDSTLSCMAGICRVVAASSCTLTPAVSRVALACVSSAASPFAR